jgi:hypothetical protein
MIPEDRIGVRQMNTLPSDEFKINVKVRYFEFVNMIAILASNRGKTIAAKIVKRATGMDIEQTLKFIDLCLDGKNLEAYSRLSEIHNV